MHAIKQNISSLKRRIANSANQCGRDPSSVRIIAVSKKHNLDSIKAAYDQGIRDFGENYLQEAIQKIELYKPKNIIWHFFKYVQILCAAISISSFVLYLPIPNRRDE